jgi:hypothetical protein
MKQLKQDMPTIRVYVPSEVRKRLKLYAAENETTIQAILENYIYNLLKIKKEDETK